MNPGYLSMNHLGKTMNRPLYQLVNLLIFILYFANTNGNRYSVITKCTHQFINDMMKQFLISVFTSLSLFGASAQAQIVGPIETYDVFVQRLESYVHGTPGHAHSNAILDITIAATTKSASFAVDVNETKKYTFPTFVTGPVTRNFKISYPSVSLYSGSYPLPTIIGGETMIYPSELYSSSGGYGYGVVLKCVATNQFTFTTTQFNAGMISASTTLKTTSGDQVQATLYPNPGNGYAHLEYNAATNDKFTVRVTDINGKMVHMYTTDLQAGSNRLPVDISNAATGTYFVHWQSATGNTGTLQLIKQ